MIYLVRHAAVVPRDGVPPREWPLSEEGRLDAAHLARRPEWRGLARVVSSPEPKAQETASPLAEAARLPVETLDCLREVERGTAVASRDDYRALVARFLTGEALDGWEERDAARTRIAGCIERLAAGPQPLAAVSHGLVLSLYVASLEGREAPSLGEWESVPFPAVAVVDPRARRLVSRFSAPRGA